MNNRFFHSLLVIVLVVLATVAFPAASVAAAALPVEQPAANNQDEQTPPVVSGSFIHILDSPAEAAGNPSLANISENGMTCAVSFGGNLGGPDNFGMVAYSEKVADTIVIGNTVVQWGTARSLTTQNGEIIEDAVYDYLVVGRDGSAAGEADSWSMMLWGDGLMFDGVTFSGDITVGDLVVSP